METMAERDGYLPISMGQLCGRSKGCDARLNQMTGSDYRALDARSARPRRLSNASNW